MWSLAWKNDKLLDKKEQGGRDLACMQEIQICNPPGPIRYLGNFQVLSKMSKDETDWMTISILHIFRINLPCYFDTYITASYI